MINFPIKLNKMSLIIIALFLGISCNSDSEFLPDSSVEEPSAIFVEDTVSTLKNNSIIIIPASTESAETNDSVVITRLTTPSIGSAEINEDNTITYTPNNDEIGTDGFDYYATITNTDNTISKEVGSIIVNITEPEETLPPTGENIYYVTTTGKSYNSGATETSAWSILHAFKSAKAGDVIYIKAGNYGALNLEVLNAGNEAKPIKFIGYKENPGDILATKGSTFKYGQSTYSTNDYPTLEGIRTGGKVTGTAITVKKPYIELHNFQIKNKISGVRISGGNNKLNNIIVLDMGNHTGYSGQGVVALGNHNKFTNSFIKNGVELFTTTGSHQIIDNNWLGCDQKINDEYSTDYYLLLSGNNGINANYNTISNNTIYREPKQYHQGHGLIIKGTGMYNEIVNNNIMNAPLEFSFSGVSYNTVTGGSITGTGLTGDGGNVIYAFILLANGAHHNTFQDMTVTGDSGVRFSDWEDGWKPNPNTDAKDAGNNNLFKNILFDDLVNGIEFSWHWNGPGAATNNTFENCTFSNIKKALFVTERPNSGTIMKDSKFINNPRAILNEHTKNRSRVAPKGQRKYLNVDFINSISENNGFTIPQ